MKKVLLLGLGILSSSIYSTNDRITLGSILVLQKELQEHGCDDLDTYYQLSHRFAGKTFSYPEPFALEVRSIMINHFRTRMANEYSKKERKKLFPLHTQKLFDALFASRVLPKNT